MTIDINNKDLGFLTAVPMTIQKFDETSECCASEVEHGYCKDCKEHAEPRHELIWCNHAGAISEEIEQVNINPDGVDHVWYENIERCDKCEAYRRDGESDWEDAPIDGVHNAVA